MDRVADARFVAQTWLTMIPWHSRRARWTRLGLTRPAQQGSTPGRLADAPAPTSLQVTVPNVVEARFTGSPAVLIGGLVLFAVGLYVGTRLAA